ncbi:MAG: alpha-amylase family glycosyl hydrolase [Anaerolineae bacterium]
MKNLVSRGLWLMLLVMLSLPAFAAVAQEPPNSAALLHDTHDDLYRTPGGPVPVNTDVILRFRTATNDVDSVAVRIYSTRAQAQDIIPMTRVATTPDGYDLWEYTLQVGEGTTVYWYRFILSKGGTAYYYEDDLRRESGEYMLANEGGPGTLFTSSPDNSFQLVVYDPEFYTPEWMRNAVVYQIFPDRFRNGDTSNDPQDGSEVFYGRLPLYFHETWNEPMVDGRVVSAPDGQGGWWGSDFYGGDLAGITEKLDYLQSLGVTAIYLNPIFLARSNHRYDTADYLMIDPILGTIDDFRTLVSEAQARGIVLILDGVFNHMSSDSMNFDRYHRFDTLGACESPDSEFRSWFYFDETPVAGGACNGGDGTFVNYTSWFGFDTIPKLNAFDRTARAYFVRGDNSVERTWLREGALGWRLDVAGDIDNGRDPANTYWENFRTVARFENPEAVVIGEEWGDASEWLLGDEWDSTMNYRMRRGILGFAINDDYRDNDSLGDTTIFSLTPTQFNGVVQALAEDTPPMAFYAMMNLLDSHDTSRLPFVLGNDPQLQRLAALTQFTLPGAPTIYYGDEVAIDAPSLVDGNGALQDDPYNRAPYPWTDTSGSFYPAPNDDMLSYYQMLGTMRRDNPALREGRMTTLVADDASGIYAFLRVAPESGNAALVVLNNGSAEQTVTLWLDRVLPYNLTMISPLTGSEIETSSGGVTVVVPANGGDVWTVTVTDSAFEAPQSPANVTAVGAVGSINLTWDASDGASSYVIYRSPVAVGGFEAVAISSEPSYTDQDVANGYVYFYAVASVGENGLEGVMSSSVFAAPSAPVDRVFFVDDVSRTAREVTLSYGLLVDYSAGIVINGVTDAEGQGEGVRAEAALAPDGANPESLDWQPMTYSADQDEADIYTIALTPQVPGTYSVLVRFSTDAGINWQTVTFADSNSVPVLVVVASDDTTAPDAPATITMGRATVSGVSLSWEAVPDAALAVYRLYRIDVASGETSLLAEIAPDTTEYTDVDVTQGQQFIYGVSAVDSSLNESSPTVGEAVTVERASVAVTIIVTVPENTPNDPPVHIVGDFHTEAYSLWNNSDPELQMTQIDDTHWQITLYLAEGSTIEYKFVRPTGSDGWGGVEKADDCSEISNRRLQIVPDANGEMLVNDLEIAKWRDLDGCG